jgi:hypothetical protein
MPETTATPAAPPPVTPAAAEPPAPAPAPGLKPLGKASDILRELEAAPPEGGAKAAPQSAEQEGAEGAKPASDKPAEPPAEETTLLARVLKKERRLEADRKKFETEQKDALEAAGNWRKLQEAKTAKGKIAALEVLFQADEIDGALYQELTDRIYSKAQSEQPISASDVDKLVAKKLEEAKNAEAEAAKKRDEEAVAAKTAKVTETEAGYLKYVVEEFRAGPGKYPAVEELPDIVTDQKVMAWVEAEYAKNGAVPDAAAVLAHFEGEARKKIEAAAAKLNPARRPGPTVTTSWSSDVTPRGRAPANLQESLEQAKREAGLLK